ncbi:DNA polymerase III subunit delta [Legionella massiliensis]|uniref:DNA polymerase III subunit delta n=1 Tax=Legionella massiliensis TaxID=1034943 RepID=A0A078L2L7_9GAMM|nr:DNA polymerase III subunit delta [Legionella massiliensis]CDZ78364.1 DNA polymerase III subunit delta [Legionella massiliensis]CEE14102.1 DNA polymerase III subunit delta [Legionella massiliensis]
MLIKQQALAVHLRQKQASAYILFGQDPYLLNEAAESIKLAWKETYASEMEQALLHLNAPSDWALAFEQANSYSLFATTVLLDLRYEKKTLETAGKDFLNKHLQDSAPSSLILLRAPNLTLKQLQNFSNHQNLHLVQAIPLQPTAMQHWIAEKLQKKTLTFVPEVPALIHLYTQGNMLACAQAIDKLELVAEPGTRLTTELVKEQLVDQCDFQLFELADACLSQQPDKVIQLLRHAYHSKAEPTLVLWILSQEIRIVLQLIELTTQQALPFNTACSQLKIWPQRAKLYQSIVKKIQAKTLLHLLQFCKTIDERIKSTQNNQIWLALEQVALSLCLTKQVGSFA